MRRILTSSAFLFLFIFIVSHCSLAGSCLAKSDVAFFERLINNTDPLLVDSFDTSYKYLLDLGKNKSMYREPVRHLFACPFKEQDTKTSDDAINEYLSYSFFLLGFQKDNSFNNKVLALKKYEKMQYFDFYIYKTSKGVKKKIAYDNIKNEIIDSKYETYNFFIAAFLGHHEDLLPVLLKRWPEADGAEGELLSGSIDWFFTVDKNATIKALKEYLKNGSDEHLKILIRKQYLSK